MALLHTNTQEVFWAYRVDHDPRIPNPTSYTFTSSGFDAFHTFGVYSTVDSSTMLGNPPAVLMNFNRLFLKLNRFICN